MEVWSDSILDWMIDSSFGCSIGSSVPILDCFDSNYLDSIGSTGLVQVALLRMEMVEILGSNLVSNLEAGMEASDSIGSIQDSKNLANNPVQRCSKKSLNGIRIDKNCRPTS